MKKLSNEELGRVNIDEFKKLKKLPITIVLDNIRSLMNIGSVFRTSDAFTIKEILLCGITAKPPHREMQKTALGATESVNWRYFDKTTDAINELKSNGITVLSIEQADEAKMLDTYEFDFSNEIALVFGNEVKGVSDEVIGLSDDCIEIPQFGTKHSLNISISAGVLIWECFQQYQNKME